MNILIKFWIFNLDLGTLFSFLFGIAIGMALFAAMYAIMVLSSMRKSKYIVKSLEEVSDVEVKEIIKIAQKAFKDKNLQGDDSTIGYCWNLSVDLVKNIAGKFFPDSRRPLLELSIDEVLMLSHYVSNRVDEVLDHKGIRIFRKIKVSSIFGASDIKRKIEDNPIIKATKKYKIAETLNSAKKVINIVNPIFWVKKIVISSLIGAVTNKLCMVVIGIVGEETYKIYSKSVFNTDVIIDSGVEGLIKDLSTDMEETVNKNQETVLKESLNEITSKIEDKKKKKGE